MRPRAAGGVWLTILLRLDRLPRLALVDTSARVSREPEWVRRRPALWDAPRLSGAGQGSGWRSPPGVEPGAAFRLAPES